MDTITYLKSLPWLFYCSKECWSELCETLTVRSILKGAHFQILSEESPLGFLDQWEGGNAPEFELFESSDPKGHYPTSTFFKFCGKYFLFNHLVTGNGVSLDCSTSPIVAYLHWPCFLRLKIWVSPASTASAPSSSSSPSQSSASTSPVPPSPDIAVLRAALEKMCSNMGEHVMTTHPALLHARGAFVSSETGSSTLSSFSDKSQPNSEDHGRTHDVSLVAKISVWNQASQQLEAQLRPTLDLDSVRATLISGTVSHPITFTSSSTGTPGKQLLGRVQRRDYATAAQDCVRFHAEGLLTPEEAASLSSSLAAARVDKENKLRQLLEHHNPGNVDMESERSKLLEELGHLASEEAALNVLPVAGIFGEPARVDPL